MKDLRVDNNEVVVTGIGAVTSIGHGKRVFWKNLIDGKNGISQIKAFNTEKMPTNYGGEIKDFDPSKHLSDERIGQLGRASQLAVVAAKLAIEDSEIHLSDIDATDMGVIVGTTMGESQAIESIDETWVTRGEENIQPKWITQYPGNTLAMNVSREIGARGISTVIPTACAAGNYAIGYGFDLIRTGRLSSVVVGGADAFSRIAYVGFNRLYAMASTMCQPFDNSREGMLLGEGAGFLVLESKRTALLRKAHIYAEVIGYALSCDATHMTIPSIDGVAHVILKALGYSGIDAAEVDYISAHGTGTKMNDKIECYAIHKVFGPRGKTIPVSSIKSMLGHTMGAASALEAIACSLAISESVIPPTINYQQHDEDCDIDCVPNNCREKKVNIALNNSFAFGGNNACLVFGDHARNG